MINALPKEAVEPYKSLLEDGKISNAFITAYMDKKYLKLHDHEFLQKHNHGQPVEDAAFTFMKMERHGGNCVTCGKPWKLTKVRNMFANFDFFEPQCYCKVCDDPLNLDGLNESKFYKNYADIPQKEMQSTYKTWDYNISANLNNAMVESHKHLTSGDMLKKKIGLVLYGSVGTGKTRCGIMLMHEIHSTNPKVSMKFVSMAQLLSNIIHAKKGYLEELLRHDLLMLDDVDKIGSENDWAKEQVFALFDSLFRENKIMIATSNASTLEEFSNKFSDAIASRIIGSCLMVKFAGTKRDDYRMKKML